MKKLSVFMMLVLLITIFKVQAQTKVLNGKVKTSAGSGLSGVIINLIGSDTKTLTDTSGNFTITASYGDSLGFSYIGFEDKRVAVGNDNNITIILDEKNNSSLGEVIVTALGIKRSERSLTYATQQINGSEVSKNKTDNFVNALSGKVAGLTIAPSASGVGGSSKVILRGVRSATGSSQPLYVIDGIPILNSSNANGQPSGSVFGGGTDGGDGISNLNPDDIASISVLEGASAAALYGYEGQNGVILVTTKKGKAGKPEVNFNSSVIFSTPTMLPKFQNKYGQSGGKLSWDTSGTVISSQDNLKTFFRTGNNFTNSINFTTGNENAQTYFSYANIKANGIEPTNNLTRHNVTLRETGRFFDNKLTLDGSASYITQRINNTPAAGLYFNPLVGLYLFPRGLSILPYKNNYLNPDSVGFKRQNWVADEDIQQNPWWILNKDPNWGTRNRFIFNGSIRYEANNWLTLQTRGSIDRISDDFEQDVYSGTQSTLNPQGNGSLGLSTQTIDQKYADLLATFKINTKSKFKADFILGTSIKDTKTSGYRIGRGSGTLFPNGPAFTDQGLSITDLFTPSNIISGQANSSSNTTAPINSLVGRTQTQSIFGNLNISYDDWAYLTFTERNDWSSLLAYTPKNSFSYPSIGLSLLVDRMVKLPDAISYLKIRGSYAEVGNPPSIPYIANILNYESGAGQLVFNNAQVIGNLKPENTKSTEFGIDIKLFKRLNVAFTYYNTKTINQLFQVSPSVASLISTAFVNAGEIKNVGQELTIGYNVLDNTKFSWTTNITASHNKNSIVKVDPDHGLETYTLSGGGGNTFESRLVKGGAAGDIYGYGFIRDDQGRIEISASGKPTYNSSQMQFLGNPNPKFQLGWNNNFTIEAFDFSFLIDGKFGGKVMSMTQAIMDYYGVTKETGDARMAGSVKVNGVDPNGNSVTSVTPINWYQTIGGRGGVGEAYMYSATTVRLREFSLGYTWLMKSSFVKSLRLAATGRNLFFFYKKAPYDPEITMSTSNQFAGIDVFNQPVTRNIGVNLSVKF